jgi:hypothetical protein
MITSRSLKIWVLSNTPNSENRSKTYLSDNFNERVIVHLLTRPYSGVFFLLF